MLGLGLELQRRHYRSDGGHRLSGSPDRWYSLSSNYVVIYRDSVEGGMVQTESGEDTVYYCVSGAGGPSSVFKFDSMMTAGPNFRYVVTDANGTILGIPALVTWLT